MSEARKDRQTDEEATWVAMTPDRRTIRATGSMSFCESVCRRSREHLIIRRIDTIKHDAYAEGTQP
jgi:hypothetical protein